MQVYSIAHTTWHTPWRGMGVMVRSFLSLKSLFTRQATHEGDACHGEHIFPPFLCLRDNCFFNTTFRTLARPIGGEKEKKHPHKSSSHPTVDHQPEPCKINLIKTLNIFIVCKDQDLALCALLRYTTIYSRLRSQCINR